MRIRTDAAIRAFRPGTSPWPARRTTIATRSACFSVTTPGCSAAAGSWRPSATPVTAIVGSATAATIASRIPAARTTSRTRSGGSIRRSAGTSRNSATCMPSHVAAAATWRNRTSGPGAHRAPIYAGRPAPAVGIMRRRWARPRSSSRTSAARAGSARARASPRRRRRAAAAAGPGLGLARRRVGGRRRRHHRRGARGPRRGRWGVERRGSLRGRRHLAPQPRQDRLHLGGHVAGELHRPRGRHVGARPHAYPGGGVGQPLPRAHHARWSTATTCRSRPRSGSTPSTGVFSEVHTHDDTGVIHIESGNTAFRADLSRRL